MGKREKLLNIGDWIEASTSVEFVYEQQPDGHDEMDIWHRNANPVMRIAKKTERQVSGQIVGGSYRQLGEYYRGTGGDEPDPPMLNVTGTVFVYQVREGFLNKPVEVLAEDITAVFHASFILKQHRVPKFKCIQPAMDERCREEYRQAAKDQHRVNGKFAKVPK